MKNRLSRSLDNVHPSTIRSFGALAKATPGCIVLTLGQPDFDTPDNIKNAAKRALDNGETSYSETIGSLALRKAISAFEKDFRGLEYSSDEILITIGAAGGLYIALKGVLDPGEEVIVPVPAFPLYETIAASCSAVFKPLDITKSGFQIDENELEALITPKTKAILINTPNNPSGAVFNKQSIESIVKAALKHDIFIITDDVYNQLVFDEDNYCDITQYPEIRDRLIIVQSFSKPYAMTGWRVGYMMAEAPIIEKFASLSQCTVSCVSTFIQTACIEALKTDSSEMIASYERRRDYTVKRFQDMGLQMPYPAGAFYAFPSIKEFGISDDEFCRRMITEAGVAAVPGSCFGTDGYIRICYCVSDHDLEEGLNRIESFVSKLRAR